MRTLSPGVIDPPAAGGFILLRGLLATFVVILCFAAAAVALAALSHGEARLLENTEREIRERNAAAMELVR